MQTSPLVMLASFLFPLALAACQVPPDADGEAGVRPRPNILFIFTDDHASHAISAYGSRINTTPNLDRIAAEGMLFRNAFCTNSICGPSRAVILTGKHSHLNGFRTNGDKFDGSQQTVAKLLQQAGYQTAMIGKWHLKTEPTGFDFWRVLIGQGPYYNPIFKTPAGKEKIEGYTTDVITDVALEWLQKDRDPERPFLMMYQHKAPHRNWQPAPRHLNLYDDVEIPEPDTLFDDYQGRTTFAAETEMTLADHFFPFDAKFEAPKNLTESQRAAWDAAYDPKNEKFFAARDSMSKDEITRWRYQRYIKDYLRCIKAVDENVGRVLEYLEESGLADNTVVIYSSDQGFYLGDHGWYDKRWMYEESLRMPLIVRWPGQVEAGAVDEHLVQNLDYAETFLDLAQAEIPDDMQGRSFLPLMLGQDVPWRPSIYYRYFEYPQPHRVPPHYGVRTQRHKLIYYPLREEWELFDLVQDPDELRSVYSDPANADLVQELKNELNRLRELYQDVD